jgi:cytidine deaminase
VASERYEIDEETAERLIAAARDAMRLSYSPYSGYPVGAALLVDGGHVIAAANIENAAYPVSLCAERAAVAAALSAGYRNLLAIAVASRGDPPAPPCGACRQVLSEFNLEMPVLVAGETGPASRHSLDALLPFSFGPKNLRHDL